jgi:predicted acylesterase/phospholipase RssA
MPRPLVVLFTYGGGIRGLIPAHIMSRLEEATGLPMCELIDVFTGPSTGAILNAAMNLPHPDRPLEPRFKARHLVRFYEREGRNIFPHDAFRSFRGFLHDFNNRTMKIAQLNALFRHGHYDSVNLGRALRALYGRAHLSDSLKSLVIPIYNINGARIEAARDTGESQNAPIHDSMPMIKEGGHALWLKNIKFDGARNPQVPPKIELYDAVMATTAAPTYFPCHGFQMSDEHGHNVAVAGIDGSIFDNPCISYLGALRQHIPADQPVLMVVLGTGINNRTYSYDQWNRYGSIGVVDPANDLPLINIFFHASESALIESFRAEMGENMYLFNKSLLSGPFAQDYPTTDIDDAGPENIRRLRNFAEMALEENRRSFDTLCGKLVKYADERKSDEKHL